MLMNPQQTCEVGKYKYYPILQVGDKGEVTLSHSETLAEIRLEFRIFQFSIWFSFL